MDGLWLDHGIAALLRYGISLRVLKLWITLQLVGWIYGQSLVTTFVRVIQILCGPLSLFRHTGQP